MNHRRTTVREQNNFIMFVYSPVIFLNNYHVALSCFCQVEIFVSPPGIRQFSVRLMGKRSRSQLALRPQIELLPSGLTLLRQIPVQTSRPAQKVNPPPLEPVTVASPLAQTPPVFLCQLVTPRQTQSIAVFYLEMNNSLLARFVFHTDVLENLFNVLP